MTERVRRLDELEPVARGITVALLAVAEAVRAENEALAAGRLTAGQVAARNERLRQVGAACALLTGQAR
jgi:hypothetical protein